MKTKTNYYRDFLTNRVDWTNRTRQTKKQSDLSKVLTYPDQRLPQYESIYAKGLKLPKMKFSH